MSASYTATLRTAMLMLPPGQSSDALDPVPAMRRELALLRIEMEKLRARECEARKTNEFLVRELDRIIDSRDQWRREAERLDALVAQTPCSTYEVPRDHPFWSLFWSNK
jgi:hypothetical protein